MMTAIFAAMFLALLALWFGRSVIAVGILVICLALTVWLFLFEIYSPATGFRMPWLQTEHAPPAPAREV
ncbi:MAG TPA: hypothetical protein VNR39_14220 [Pseudolabrys sp.]|nr:hypothetical protein [Pseudolabrys sp.]